MLGDSALIDLLRRFLDGALDFETFERGFLRTYKQSPVEDVGLQGPLGRAFLAVEAYHPGMTPTTETVHNSTYETMLAALRAAREEIDSGSG